MASAAKRKYVSKSNQEELLILFYDNLGNNEDTFLGNKFVLEEESDFESDISSISNKSDDEIEQAVAPDFADEPAVALVVDEPAVAYVANELPVALVTDEILVSDARKTMLKNWETVPNEANLRQCCKYLQAYPWTTRCSKESPNTTQII